MSTRFAMVLVIIINSNFLFSQSADEYKIKSAFLEKFTRFIEWPSGSDIEDKSKAFVIGVVGDNSFRRTLEKDYSNRTIKNKSVKVLFFASTDEMGECNLLFVGRSQNENLEYILKYLRNKSVLTIGDTEGFAERGLQINFYIVNSNIRFEINADALIKSKLSASSLLLDYAKITRSKGN